MDVQKVKCEVSTDVFGTDLEGLWSCDNHPHEVFYPIPLRNTYYENKVIQHLFPLYKEIVRSGFPWKCPTCKEPMRYVEKRNATTVG